MKFCLLFAAFLSAAAAVSYEDVLFEEFNLFKAQYQKSYKTPVENFRRMEVFLKTKYKVAQHNLRFRNGEETYEMEVNAFADWFPEEIAKLTGKNLIDGHPSGEIYKPINGTVPDAINWVEKGAVSPVKDQGLCGSCYAFSTIGALESQHYFKTKKMIRYSEQQIVDCSSEYGNEGCNGGSTHYTFIYIAQNGGVNTEDSYPYEAEEGNCRYNKTNIRATCKDFISIPKGEELLKNAVANNGPMSIIITCLDSFHLYKRGVYFEPKCKDNVKWNHAVLVVGYGTDPETKQPYWLVKNSWGTRWGEKGYIKMARNKDNMCGVASFAIYPKL